MIYLALPELTHVAKRVIGDQFAVRDLGLPGCSLTRPQTTVFGKDGYQKVEDKATALLHFASLFPVSRPTRLSCRPPAETVMT